MGLLVDPSSNIHTWRRWFASLNIDECITREWRITGVNILDCVNGTKGGRSAHYQYLGIGYFCYKNNTNTHLKEIGHVCLCVYIYTYTHTHSINISDPALQLHNYQLSPHNSFISRGIRRVDFNRKKKTEKLLRHSDDVTQEKSTWLLNLKWVMKSPKFTPTPPNTPSPSPPPSLLKLMKPPSPLSSSISALGDFLTQRFFFLVGD